MKKTVLVALAATMAVSACTTTDPYTGEQKVSNTAGGAALGALAGAGVGLLAGGDDRRNALIGAGIGALAGGAVGSVMDRNEAELRAQLQGTGVSVTRVGDRIVLNMPSDITFATDQDSVKPQFYPVLNSVGLVLKKFNQTIVDVYGHTDFDRRRHLQLQPVAAPRAGGRQLPVGAGRRFPPLRRHRLRRDAAGRRQQLAAGRALNRRVEIQLSPLT